MAIPRNKCLDLYRTMQKIRKFELQTGKSFREGEVLGFVHLAAGEEAIEATVTSCLNQDDFITSNHRGHGHLIGKGADMKLMMAELFGKETGYCKGKGGSMHICVPEMGIIGSNGILGPGFTMACGAAYAAKVRNTGQIAVCFFGDGCSAQGALHEALNASAIWKLPVVFLNENNGYGVSAKRTNVMAAENVSDYAKASNIPTYIVEGNDANAVYDAVTKAIDHARRGDGPVFVECITYRHRGHFEGEPEIYRPKEEIEAWKKQDPIKKFEQYIIDNDIADKDTLKQIADEVKREVADAVEFARNSKFPELESAVKDVYSDIVEEGR